MMKKKPNMATGLSTCWMAGLRKRDKYKIMLKNYFKIAFRNLLKYKKYSLINVLGLAIGLACFIIIMLWVQDELSFDRFHKNADDIYLIIRLDSGESDVSSAKMLAPALVQELPEVINATSFNPLPESFKGLIEYKNNRFEENLALVEPRFFDIFSFNFKEGDPESALKDPNSMIMTEKMRQKYFGDDKGLGESITLSLLGQKRTLKVTGILKNIPHNSHIQREIFTPIDFIKTYGIDWDNWHSRTVYNYIQTQGSVNLQQLERKILECKQRNYHEENVSYSLLPLTKIHLHSQNIGFFTSTGDIKYVYIFSVIAGLILLVASMNYMNLSNALSLKRARTIGIQKVVGAQRNHLMGQYFGETFILTALALACALILVQLLLPVLNQVSGKELATNYFSLEFWIALLVIVLLTSFISGLYPAVFISGFQPMKVLKGKLGTTSSGLNLKKGLIIFQFASSILIMICTIIVFNQLNFIQNTDMGYDKENIVCLKIKGDISSRFEAFKNSLMNDPRVLNISRSEPPQAEELGKTEDVHWEGKSQKFSAWLIHVDSDFADTYRMKMQSGRFYSSEHPTDATEAYVLNEAAVRGMGIEDPVGKDLTVWGRTCKIIGVVKDFHFNSLHHAIEPVILRIPNPDQMNLFYRIISVRLASGPIPENLSFVENTWRSFYPSESFDYYFVDEKLASGYQAEMRMGRIFEYFSFIAIFIACLGLYGLIAFTIEQKFKDIGVHKVLGASVTNIVYLISKSYLGWIIISNLIAWPIAWVAVNKWLQNFAYRININIGVFFIAGLATLSIALLTISWQTIKAATANPVESLRYE
jgi:putative ABC transport system permease protein